MGSVAKEQRRLDQLQLVETKFALVIAQKINPPGDQDALDQFLPPEYSEVVYTGSNNDSKLLKEFHLDPKKERQIRKSFGKLDQQPKILIVTEKLLTGFDAPPATYLYIDKQMQDHGLFQAICRTNRLDGDDKDYGHIVDFKELFGDVLPRLGYTHNDAW